MDYTIRPAVLSDATAVAELVNAAYQHYVPRIGMLPGPMTRDYEKVIGDQQVTIAERDGAMVAVLALDVTEEGFLIDNVAVHPSCQGKGLGHALLRLAESRALDAGFTSIYLYTHEKMTENQALYARLGYAEYLRRTDNGLTRVYMRKSLG
jgi:N-acetylglutamate synthase-like GNAT family acetyltransferase